MSKLESFRCCFRDNISQQFSSVDSRTRSSRKSDSRGRQRTLHYSQQRLISPFL